MIDVKIEPDGCSAEESKYPYTGISKCGNHMVVFTNPFTGFAIKSNYHKLFEVKSHWAEATFSPFKGKITLSNG